MNLDKKYTLDIAVKCSNFYKWMHDSAIKNDINPENALNVCIKTLEHLHSTQNNYKSKKG